MNRIQERWGAHLFLIPKTKGLFSYQADVAVFSGEEAAQTPQLLHPLDRKEKMAFYENHKARFKTVTLYTVLYLFFLRVFARKTDEFLKIRSNCYITKRERDECHLLYLRTRIELTGRQFVEAQEGLEKLNKSHSIVHISEDIRRLKEEKKELEKELHQLDHAEQIPTIQKLQGRIKQAEQSIEDLEKRREELHSKKARLELRYKTYETDIKHFESAIKDVFSK